MLNQVRELRRPAKSFCVAKLSVAGEPEPLEGVFKQVGKICGNGNDNGSGNENGSGNN